MTILLDQPIRRRVRTQRRLMTIADVDALPTQLPTGPVDYELISGVLTIMAPASGGHGRKQLRIGTYLALFGDLKGLGRAYTNAGLILSRNPDTLVSPDAMYIADQSKPERLSPEGYVESNPDVAVEVKSKNDFLPEIMAKVALYLTHGVGQVWILDPRKKTVTIHRSKKKPKVLFAHDTLTSDGLIPDFSVLVAELFPD